MYRQGHIPNPSFSFYFDLRDQGEPRSEMVLGGHDPEYMDKEFTFTPVVDPAYWTIEYSGLKLGGERIRLSPRDTFNKRRMVKTRTMIDTGGSLIQLPLYQFEQVMKKIN